MKLTVILPVYNEAPTLCQIVERVRQVELPLEFIAVDDCSTDGSREMLKELEEDIAGFRVLYHPENRGKGAAVRTAVPHATGDYVVIQDGDLEYDPQDFHRLLEPVQREGAEVVYGSRLLEGRPDMSLLFYLGNRLLTLATRLLFGCPLTDMETCYKLVRRDILQSLPLTADRFDFEPEITAQILKRGYRIREVPIHYRARSQEEGKKIGWRDGVLALMTLLRYRFTS